MAALNGIIQVKKRYSFATVVPSTHVEDELGMSNALHGIIFFAVVQVKGSKLSNRSLDGDEIMPLLYKEHISRT